jgi:hypothetical protein
MSKLKKIIFTWRRLLFSRFSLLLSAQCAIDGVFFDYSLQGLFNDINY